MLLLSFSVNAENQINEETVKKITENEKIEISFKVGENLLKINGENIQVETPFVLNGTTLVPLRVIAEAFDSKVEWNEEDQSITLTYSDVIIQLTIDSKEAIVDGHKIEMPEAPTISNGVTMVPLRFITENFGADVKYDDDTEQITVTKDIAKSNSIKDFALLLKKTTKERVGDSFNNWSIALPKKLKMTYRNFNGTTNAFEADDESYSLVISIYDQGDETIDTIIQGQLDYAKGFTILEQGKVTKNNTECALIAYRGKYGTLEERAFINDNKIYYLFLYVNDYNNYKNNKEISNMLDSFQLKFTGGSKTEDLSDVDDKGYRLYDTKGYKWMANILADWIEIKNENKENEVLFIEPQRDSEKQSSLIYFDMYSIEDGVTLDEWINHEINDIKDEYNPSRISISDTDDTIINNAKAKTLLLTIKYKDKTSYYYNVYFYGNKYKYRIGYLMGSESYENSSERQKVENMLRSFKFSEPDFEEIGKLVDPDMIKTSEAVRELSSKEYGWKCEIPVSWTENKSNNGKDRISYSDKEREKGIEIIIIKDKKISAVDFVDYYDKELTKDKKASGELKIEKRETLSEKKTKVYKFTNTSTYDNIDYKEIVYIFKIGDCIYYVTLYTNDLFYGEKTKNLLDQVWNSMSFE